MRILKHALLSILRKPTKAMMIFAIMVLVLGLVFTGIIIQNSVVESKKYVRIQLGATVSYSADYMAAMKDEVEDYDQLSLSKTVADEISNDSRVKQHYLNFSAYTTSKELKSGKNTKTQSSGETPISSTDIEGGMESYFVLNGTSASIPLEFENKTLKLKEGRYLTLEETNNGVNLVIISEEVAGKNGKIISDKIKLSNWEGKEKEYEIIGIYSGASEMSVDSIYTSTRVALDFEEIVEGEEIYTSINFLLTDPLEVDDFVAFHKEKLPSKYTTLTANESEYTKLTKPLNLMSIITSILIWVVFGAGALIVLAIVTIFVRDRKFEIGLLLASGESKIKIVIQFIVELVVIGCFAFILSIGISQFSSEFIGNWIVENQLVEEETTDYSDYLYFDETPKIEIDMNNIASDFNVSIGLDVIINLLFISISILLFAASIPLITIMSYKPREALQN